MTAVQTPQKALPEPLAIHRRKTRLSWMFAGLLVLIAMFAAVSVFGNENFGWPVVAQYFFNIQILEGLGRTVLLTAVAMSIGIILGVVLAVMRLSDNVVLQSVSWLYTWFFRSIPQLVQLIFWFNFAALYRSIVVGIPFGPELFAWNTNDIITPWSAAILGFGLSQAAYTGEVMRAGINSVSDGQRRAAKAQGMTPMLSFFRIIFPQAMRVIIPPVGNELISMVKNTALVSTIALADLLYSAQLIYSRNFETIPLLIVATLWYLVIVSLLSIGQHYIEKHYNRG
ncbi:amino acid ABC transporter permease [Brevibacterium sp. RIT 803]|uniref:amino acid ABC transporter permease n=1 Tax=Brevibacterium sp. RIT 803 TaxID=2810210 RepID=UPI0019520E61|nr:amino acid ABC transporter permease [Brevibacterium sp. RIT 803]MBM6590802.1 amino acid ABC transporter permease [Brevibacterium sp. RIT 803]